MIEQEVLEIINDPEYDGEGLWKLASQFHHDRDISDLLDLLNSKDPELVSIGTWVLNELPVELYDSDALLSRLRELIDHEEPSVRFNALGALFPFLKPEDAYTKSLLKKLLNDPNEGVRMRAEAAKSRLF